MWCRLLGALVVIWGLAVALYLGWCLNRVSGTVLMSDRAWPRPWPYPDSWLARWHNQIDAANPAPPGYTKICGELDRLRGRLRIYTLSVFAVIAVGVLLVLWPQSGRQFFQESSVQRGIAIGLVIGVTWTVILAHLTDGPPSVWRSLGVYAIGFAIAGGVVGAVRHFPELVGLCAGSLTSVVLAVIVKPDVDLPLLEGPNYQLTLRELLFGLGVDWGLHRLLVFGGFGLIWGLVLGGLHRRFNPVVNHRLSRTAAGPSEAW